MRRWAWAGPISGVFDEDDTRGAVHRDEFHARPERCHEYRAPMPAKSVLFPPFTKFSELKMDDPVKPD